jgi:hypothetical protein
LKSKGVNYNSTGKGDEELLREMVYLLLHWRGVKMQLYKLSLWQLTTGFV